ncbi:hypothetical protein JQK88_15785 [Mesorhizobium caraganae]|uniref:hypothetical protein n=1 Tax=Mesorhizobium caraganae TaxID=483206 RepID=UPI001939F68B|nr:hypothetical protein [Mesorhizobium caraganae]MBM2712690.1 hypothetical protein [Mesorhizobium caraganae]
MGSIKDLNKAIIKEPESAGAKIERKNPSDKDPGGATKLREPRTGRQPSTDPFSNRRSDARPVSGKTTRPTEKPENSHAARTRAD